MAGWERPLNTRRSCCSISQPILVFLVSGLKFDIGVYRITLCPACGLEMHVEERHNLAVEYPDVVKRLQARVQLTDAVLNLETGVPVSL